jgi:hypothetical protein
MRRMPDGNPERAARDTAQSRRSLDPGYISARVCCPAGTVPSSMGGKIVLTIAA